MGRGRARLAWPGWESQLWACASGHSRVWVSLELCMLCRRGPAMALPAGPPLVHRHAATKLLLVLLLLILLLLILLSGCGLPVAGQGMGVI